MMLRKIGIHTDSQEMLSMLLILLVTARLAHGQFCQNVADSSFGELRDRGDLNLARSVSVSLSDVDDETDEQDGYLVDEGTVRPDLFIAVNDNLSMILTARLHNNTNLSQVYVIVTSMNELVCINNSLMDEPLMDEMNIKLQIGCTGISTTVVTLCVYLTDQPFIEGNGTHHTITVPLNVGCTVAASVVESQCGTSSSNVQQLGQFCLTPSQIPELFKSEQGRWGILLSGASSMEFCLLSRGELIPLLESADVVKQFPFYRNLSVVQFDIINNNLKSPYPLLFFVNFTSTNSSISVANLSTTTGIVNTNETFTFDVALPCFLEEGVLFDVTLVWSQFQPNGQLIWKQYDSYLFRDCTVTTSNNASTTAKEDNLVEVIIAVPIVVVVFLLFLLAGTTLCVLWYRLRYKKDLKNQEVDTNSNPCYVYLENGLKPLDKYGIDYDYNTLNLENKIGEGEFGIVYKASAPGLKRGDWEISGDDFVAVKMLKSDADSKMMLDFQKEVDTVVNFEHLNVIRLLGICTKQINQTCMIFEYMELGALRELLQKSNPRNTDFYQLSPDEVTVKPSQFLTICIQLAKGLDYLSKQRFVHRDIATRNCLVDSQFVCKIADFGLSRDVYESDYYKVGSKSACLPVRWMPPESLLYGRFTIKSDVWSYGVLMWEVFTFAARPYFGATNHEVIDKIRGMVLLDCPPICTQEIYVIMVQCWEKMPIKRPPIGQILEALERLQNSNITVVKDIENYVNLQPLTMGSIYAT